MHVLNRTGLAAMQPQLTEALRQSIAQLTTECAKLCAENEQLRSGCQQEQPLGNDLSEALNGARADGLWQVGQVPMPQTDKVLHPSGTAPLLLPGLVDTSPAVEATTSAWSLEVEPGSSPLKSTNKSMLTVPLSPASYDLPTRTMSWTEHNELHPSVETCEGMPLAGSKLHLLRTRKEPRASRLREAAKNVMERFHAVSFTRTDLGNGETSQSVFRHIVHNLTFKVLQTLAIAANTVYMGVAVDQQVKKSWEHLHGLPHEENSVIPDVIFSVWFTLELVLRIGAERKQFLVGDDHWWNIFDTFLVASSVIELVIPQVVNVSFLRIFRVFRVVRVIRVVRTVKALSQLRTMVFAMLNSFISLTWALLMITIIIYVFAIVFDGGVVLHFESLDSNNAEHMEEAADVHYNFGTLYETMVSLFSAVTGGNDWMGYGELIRRIRHGEIYFFIFLFYIGFSMIGLLNVVTGIFVDSAVCTRTDDEIVQGWKDDLERTTKECKAIFMQADTDGDGMVTYEELMAQLENPRVSAYFAGLQIDPDESEILFTLLDTDSSGKVDVEEFIDGTMRLKGTAKSIDIMALMFDHAKFSMKFNKLCSFTEDTLREIRDVLMPGSDPTPRMFLPLHTTLANHNKWTSHQSRIWKS